MSEPTPRYPSELVHRQIETVLTGWGMRPDAVRVSAAIMVETDLSGVDSHGVSMLIMYSQMRRAGQIKLDAEPRIVRQSASTALIDADAGLGHPAAKMGMDLAITKAEVHDIGWVSVVNSHHFGAAGYYALMAARRGLIGLVSCSTRVVSVVPTFGAEPVLGTNPIAIAAPAGTNPPLLIDMSTSVVAANKVKIYAFNEKPLPTGWVVDGEGRSVTDSARAYHTLFNAPDGGLCPVGGAGTDMGGHKGYGLSVFAQILGSTLAGGSFSPIRNRTQRPSDPDNIGHCFMALNPAAFRDPADFAADIDEIIETLRNTRPADPAQPVILPGDPERLSREARLQDGIPISPSLGEALRAVAADAGVPFLLG